MVEVTETDAVNDVDAAGLTLQRLRDAGVLVAIDDFGTGYSSLAYLKRLPVDGWAIETEPVLRSGIAGTKVHVHTEDDPPSRTAGQVMEIVTGAGLPDRVERRALATFRALAEAEGRLHRQPPETVHFHEVGALDAIVDVVGTCAALELLDVDEIASSPVADGSGTVRAAHGVLPVPVPAVDNLLSSTW